MIDQPTIDRITDVANIVEVVSDFVTLRKRGVNYVGLCPFHKDSTPSFSVSPSKNICKCFACGEGGAPVYFLMKHEQLSYFDALRYLAKKYNIEIEERELTAEEKQAKGDRESMFIVNAWAQQYFSSLLHEHQDGRSIGLSYFAERGFREDIIRKFNLGYSLDQWDALYKEAIRKGYKKEYLEKTGLVLSYDNGRVNDRFRGRVIFPVHTLSGKVVAFGGRILKKDDKAAKYVNSPESAIYHKSNELYGIFFAKQAIVKQERCFLVEGYTDVISMHQAGIENVVSSSGTALTAGQIRLLRRFTTNITVLYDGDAAGIKAALRGIDMLLEEGMNVKVVLLPEGEDPDSFAKTHSASQFADFIREKETDFIRFKTKLLLDAAEADPIKRSELITDIIRSVSVIPDNIARSVYIRECSSMMEIDEEVLLSEVNKLKKQRKASNPPQTFAKPSKTLPPTSPPSVGGDLPPVGEHVVSNTEEPPDFPSPTLDEYEIESNINEQGGSAISQNLQTKTAQFEMYELALARYIVRYGEHVLYDYEDETSGERVVFSVSEYILFDLERDGIHFENPIIRKVALEAVERQKAQEHFVAQRYFVSHPDMAVSGLAVDLVSDKYQLSKMHTRYKEIESEEDRLEQSILQDIFALKDAYVMQQIKELQLKIRSLQMSKSIEDILPLIEQLAGLNEVKKSLCKELGERIVLKR